MKFRIYTQLERHFMATFKRVVPKERNIFEAGATGSTFFFVLSVLYLMALGFDLNDRAIQLVCIAFSALGFLVLMAIQSG
jgi:hypothetical protein